MRRAEQILREIESRRNQGAGLSSFRQYMHSLQDPQDAYPCIHIAGTNGKGSTLNDIRSVLQKAGLRVGTFSSPYLEVHYDRIRINDMFIDETDFIRYYDQYHEQWYGYGFGSFEIDTIIAFLYFRDQKVDIAVIEAGIGGRYDCTNVVNPLISVITNIGMDHMDRLGDSYEQIAWQKGGIIKAGVPIITAERKPQALSVLQQIADAQHAELICVKQAEQIVQDAQSLSFTYQGLAVRLPQVARYQIDNCVCALEALAQYQKITGQRFRDSWIQSGLAQAVWKGRFETVWEKPKIIIDGAHNEDGIRALCETIREMGHVRILFAALKDKDTDSMMKQLCAISDDVCVSEFDDPRCKPCAQLAADFPVRIDQDYRHAIKQAMKDAQTPLIITGSLYFISAVRRFMQEQRHE